MPHTKQGF